MTGLTGYQAVASLAQQPRYMIEDLGILLAARQSEQRKRWSRRMPVRWARTARQVHTYRITARATGGNSGSVAAMESYFVGQPPSY